MMSKKTRYAIVMGISVLMNQVFYILASESVLDLPFWMDMSGTVFAAIVLEPTAGLLVGFVNNFYLALTLMSSSSILYFAVSAAAALICGLCMRTREGALSWKRILPTMGLLWLVSSALSTLLTLWRSGGVPDLNWEKMYYEMALAWGWHPSLACFFGTAVIKIYDVLAATAVVIVFWLVLPKSLTLRGGENKLRE